MTLMETLIALGVCGLAMGAIVNGYYFAATSAEKSGLSLAANASAVRRIEETRSATWDLSASPNIDQLVSSNFPQKVVTLDLSGTSTNVTYATNITTITLVSTNPPLKTIHVDCIYAVRGRVNKLFTNSIETCRAPDQ